MTGIKHYFIVWGSSVHTVRGGSGINEREAALDAFGTYDPKRMTFKEAKLSEMQSDRKRFSLIKKLLTEHATRFQFDRGISRLVQLELEENPFLREAK